jgi:hypothetical protein
MESVPYSEEPRKRWRLRVYVGKPVENKADNGKCAVCGSRSGNAAVTVRERVESKGPGRKERQSRPKLSLFAQGVFSDPMPD